MTTSFCSVLPCITSGHELQQTYPCRVDCHKHGRDVDGFSWVGQINCLACHAERCSGCQRDEEKSDD